MSENRFVSCRSLFVDEGLAEQYPNNIAWKTHTFGIEHWKPTTRSHG